ncbi:hypothetical protein ACHAQA_010005 [Verticillium albo-atrum]
MDADLRIATISPRSFLFFIVANIGADAVHRPLAVTYRQGRGHGPGRTPENGRQRVRQVVQDCARAVDILTDSGNRAAIEAELSMAAAEHRRGRRSSEQPETQRVQVPDQPQPSLADDMFFRPPQSDPSQQRPPDSSPVVTTDAVREFPFISSCLRLALNRVESGARFSDVREQPLNTTFRDDVLEYGAVVIDLSDLDNVMYGIIGSKITYVGAEGSTFAGTWGWDSVESKYHGPPPVLYLDNSSGRTPFSASAYMARFDYPEALDGLERLQQHGIVDANTLRYIWPTSLTGSSGNSTTAEPTVSMGDDDANVQETVSTLASLAHSEALDLEAYRKFIIFPNFQTHLQKRLLEDSENLRPFGASAQLLPLAYAGRRHLDLAALRNLTYEHVANTLDSAELSDTRALSICIDTMEGSLTPLLESVARHKSIRDVCFLQGPSRISDDRSAEVFSQICSSPLGSAILSSRNLFVTCAFSAPLRRAVWLRDPKTGARLVPPALRSVFPVQHMFVRQQFIPEEQVEPQDFRDWEADQDEDEGDDEEEDEQDHSGNPTFRPCHFFLGDALLKPEPFVRGFLQYCLSGLEDDRLVSFAATKLSPSIDTQGNPISPLPAENLAIREILSVQSSSQATSTADSDVTQPTEENWPPPSPLEPGSWVVVVSNEWYTTRKRRESRRRYLSWGYSGDSRIGVPIVRYAFLRARRRISITLSNTDAATGLSEHLGHLVGPDSIEVVGGVEAFLRKTLDMSEVDHQGLLNDACSSVEETKTKLRTRWCLGEWPNADLPADMDLLKVLDDGAARAILKDFFADATHTQGALAVAVRDHDSPVEPLSRWYPELAAISPSLAPVPRDGALFRSLNEKHTVGGSSPLGTLRQLELPNPYKTRKNNIQKSSTWIYTPPIIVPST